MFKVNNIDKKITSISLVFVSLLITFTLFRTMTWLFYCRFCLFKLIPITKYLFIVNKRHLGNFCRRFFRAFITNFQQGFTHSEDMSNKLFSIQQAFTCSNVTMKTPKQCGMFKVNKKDTRTTQLPSF